MVEAELLFRRSRALKEELLGIAHPDVAVTADNLALLFLSLGRLQESQALSKRAVEICRQALPPAHLTLEVCQRTRQTLAGFTPDQGL